MKAESIVRLTGVSKRFQNATALEDVSFEVLPGEVIGIIGPSGGGKSTLLRCIDLLTAISGGTIEYRLSASSLLRATEAGVTDSRTLVPPSSVRRSIGFVFQHLHLWPERSVMENLTLAAKVVAGMNRDEAEQRARELAAQFGFDEKLMARVWQLSGGQRQRVAIARALMLDPTLLLLDEVTSALDPILTADVMQAIRGLRDRGIAMLVVSHHIRFVAGLCDRLVFLDGGRIVECGPTREVLRSTGNAVVERFLAIVDEAR